jgi:hypothetical protein
MRQRPQVIVSSKDPIYALRQSLRGKATQKLSERISFLTIITWSRRLAILCFSDERNTARLHKVSTLGNGLQAIGFA